MKATLLEHRCAPARYPDGERDCVRGMIANHADELSAMSDVAGWQSRRVSAKRSK
jgi:hypothetical protein